MEPLRVYIDTSVFGGFFDEEFRQATRGFFQGVRAGKAVALLSDLLVAELADAPESVQELLEDVLQFGFERLELSREAEDLRDAYIAAGVLSPRWGDDALHVAHAAVSGADVIVSWNFRHLVNPLRIRRFNGVNAEQGYGPVVIMTPGDVRDVWREDERDENEQDV